MLGSLVGLAMGFWVPMTAMPQRTALSHAFGAFAAALVGISEFYRHGGHVDKITMSALGFEVMLGALTTTGSLLAFAKLQGLVRGTPLTYKGQNIFNMALLATTIGIFIYLIVVPGSLPLFFVMAGSGVCVWAFAGDADWLGRHAGRDVAAEFLCGSGFSGDWVCA